MWKLKLKLYCFSDRWDLGRWQEKVATFYGGYTPWWLDNKFVDSLSESNTTWSSCYLVPGLYFLWYGRFTENVQRYVFEYEQSKTGSGKLNLWNNDYRLIARFGFQTSYPNIRSFISLLCQTLMQTYALRITFHRGNLSLVF